MILALVFSLLTTDYPARFLNCHDGDTCRFSVVLLQRAERLGPDFTLAQLVTQISTVRFCGINAPELSETGGYTARDALASRLERATDVVLSVPKRYRDKYGRLLATVKADGVDLNKWMLQSENAVPYLTDGCD